MDTTTLLRKSIIQKAKTIGCIDDVTNMTEINAVRFIQANEGHSQCFGKEEPYRPTQYNEKRCAIADCYWGMACNNYRLIDLHPVDKSFPQISGSELDEFTRFLSECQQRVAPKIQRNELGMQIRSYKNLISATRKMLLATPKTIVGENIEDKQSLTAHVLRQAGSISWIHGGYPQVSITQVIDVLLTSDIKSLRKWYLETNKFIHNGFLDYYPLIKTVESSISGSPKFVTQNQDPTFPFNAYPDQLTLETFSAPHIGLPDGDIMLSHKEYAPILNLDLPVLEEVDFDTLYKLMSDYPEELLAFRDFLHSEVDNMRDAAVGSEHFSQDCRRIERNIRSQMRKLSSDYKKAKLKTAFALTGCAIASWTLVLYCLVKGTGDLLAVLGPGGILTTVSAAYSDYLVKRLGLKDDPVYFLWMIGDTSNTMSSD